MKFILASKSPRRSELLKQIGISFECVPADVEETGMGEQKPSSFAEMNALMKSEKVAELYPDDIVIGSDTIVVYENTIFGQPENEEHAYEMLKQLSGKTHEVITGVAIICKSKNIREITYERTYVHMRNISEHAIRSYINTGEPLDKAGAYGIQGKAALFVDKIDGCYNNVVGLPVSLLCVLLNKHSIHLFWSEMRNTLSVLI